jgi:hypothetical protein
MATVEQLREQERIEPREAGEGIVLHDVPWALYEALRDVEANWHIKMTYDDGGVSDLMTFVEWRPGAGGTNWIRAFRVWARLKFANQFRQA